MVILETQDGTLSERVDSLILAFKGVEPLRATTTPHEAIRELIARSEGLERAVREIAREVEELAIVVGRHESDWE
jgi:hypothetical protein